MAKFAFVVPPFEGHVNPTLSIGKELLKRGNEVVWIGVDQQLETVLPPGGKFLFIAHNYDDQFLKEFKKERTQITIQGLESLKSLYEDILTPLNQYMLDGILLYLSEFRPDVLIYDHQLYAGAVAAVKLNIPYAASVTAQTSIKSFNPMPKLSEWDDEQVVGFQQRNGISGSGRLDESASILLVYTSKLFFGSGDELPPNYQFVGPVIKDRPTNYDFDWERFESRKHRKCILVSIGTIFDNEEMQSFFNKVIEALKDENLTVIMISDPELFKEIPNNFIIQKRIPQLQLIPYMELVVCHGGQNTVSETLLQGIPLIILPIAFDQSQVANNVVLCNAGIRLKFKRFKSDELKKSVHEILSNDTYRENALKLQASFKEAGGVDRAASLLENLVSRKADDTIEIRT